MKKITLVWTEDEVGYMEGLYVDGILVRQDFEITRQDILEALGANADQYEVEMDNNTWTFPKNLEDLS